MHQDCNTWCFRAGKGTENRGESCIEVHKLSIINSINNGGEFRLAIRQTAEPYGQHYGSHNYNKGCNSSLELQMNNS